MNVANRKIYRILVFHRLWKWIFTPEKSVPSTFTALTVFQTWEQKENEQFLSESWTKNSGNLKSQKFFIFCNIFINFFLADAKVRWFIKLVTLFLPPVHLTKLSSFNKHVFFCEEDAVKKIQLLETYFS